MLDASKSYRVTAEFGVATDTGDATGRVTERAEARWPGQEAFEEALAALRGPITQIPPMYSAIHYEGRRLYELARQGQEVPRAPRSVEILELAVESLEWPRLTLFVHCSKGTYVRTLVTDLAASLGTYGHVTSLRRLAIGPFLESGLISMETLEQAAAEGTEALDHWLLGIDSALGHLPSSTVSPKSACALRQGQQVLVAAGDGAATVRIYEDGAGFVGLGHLAPSGELRPTRIFPA
jgi:tRNA pseudouridine55 synthase